MYKESCQKVLKITKHLLLNNLTQEKKYGKVLQ